MLLGIDVGTTGTKTILADYSGNIVASSYKGYKTYSEKEGFVEQDSREWWDAVVYTVRRCLYDAGAGKNEIKAISLSTQGATLVPVDENCVPLTSAIVWMDIRGKEQSLQLKTLKGEDFFITKPAGDCPTVLI